MFDLFGGGDFTADDSARLRRVERKLDLILRHLGVEYATGDGELPDGAKAFADRGATIAAIKSYRDETGAGLREAKHAVDAYLSRRRGQA